MVMTSTCSLVSEVKRTTFRKTTLLDPSIIRLGSWQGSPGIKGVESGNKIWYTTNEEDSLDSRYHLAKQNLIDARSSAGKNGLTELYGVDPTKMAAHPIDTILENKT